MGYMYIDNLYNNGEILLFKECYALEKIHGTSAKIIWKDEKVIFFSGGEKHEKFIELFDEEKLTKRFKELFECDVVIYGEAYGGKCQGMSDTYGKKLKFIVFDVKVDNNWLDVPNAFDVTDKLKLEFVSFNKISTDLKEIDKQRDLPSIQARKNNIEGDKIREGIVLRPLIELTKNNGNRIIVKHKRDEFRETLSKRKVMSPEKQKLWDDAKAIAEEWVVPMRLTHVLDKLNNPDKIENTREVIIAMIEDVKREGKEEIIWAKEVEGALGKKTAQLYKQKISKIK